MKRLLRWLYPKTLLRGLVFGYLFGFLAVPVLGVAIAIQNGDSLLSGLRLGPGLVYGVVWAVIWGMSGIACQFTRTHVGTVAMACAVACGVGYSFWEGPKRLHPWLFLTVPFYTFLAFLPCALLCAGIGAMFGLVDDIE
jgi:hypothetical protein